MTDLCPLVLHKGLHPLARQLCKTGCLVAHRRALWCAAMGVDPDLLCVCVSVRGKGVGDQVFAGTIYSATAWGNRSVSFHCFSLLCTRSIQHAFHFEEE